METGRGANLWLGIDSVSMYARMIAILKIGPIFLYFFFELLKLFRGFCTDELE